MILLRGGDNIFTDGFNVAHEMSAECPDHFAALTQLPLDRTDTGVEKYEYNIRSRKPIVG